MLTTFRMGLAALAESSPDANDEMVAEADANSKARQSNFMLKTEPRATIDLLINWSTSELNTLLDPTTYLDYTDCWIQLVTAPTMAVTS